LDLQIWMPEVPTVQSEQVGRKHVQWLRPSAYTRACARF
jgi:hypothetical protein